ncbi:MAG: hypothetical protein ABID63_11140 [Pseudomonadota bacterium]
MPVSLTSARIGHPQERCLRLARLIAIELASVQRPTGDFPQPGFYAGAFAVALWQHLDPVTFADPVARALSFLRTEPKTRTWHYEFIDYALRQAPGIADATRKEILQDARPQNPPVANWRLMRLITLAQGNRRERLHAILAGWFFTRQFVRGGLIYDRKGCFSAQYHAFCAMLLSQSNDAKHRQLAQDATALIAKLTDDHGRANLIGRGAGQSFGAVAALYALLAHGYVPEATAILTRLESAMLTGNSLPLNLLASGGLPGNAPDPAPDHPDTPGWYSYNRHYDYLAFAGYVLARAAQLPAISPPEHASLPDLPPDTLGFYRGDRYQAYGCVRGTAPYDITPAPVVVADGAVLLPPTGGEQHFRSLYDSASLPLPCLPRGRHFARFIGGTIGSDDMRIDFDLAGCKGQRHVHFTADHIRITDHITPADDRSGTDDEFRLLRLFLPTGLVLHQPAPDILTNPDSGLILQGSGPLHVGTSHHFSAFGPVQLVFLTACMGQDGMCRGSVRLSWGVV